MRVADDFCKEYVAKGLPVAVPAVVSNVTVMSLTIVLGPEYVAHTVTRPLDSDTIVLVAVTITSATKV